MRKSLVGKSGYSHYLHGHRKPKRTDHVDDDRHGYCSELGGVCAASEFHLQAAVPYPVKAQRVTASVERSLGLDIEAKTLCLPNRQDNEIAFTSQIGGMNRNRNTFTSRFGGITRKRLVYLPIQEDNEIW